jgi:hypothetical protein
MEHRTGVVLHAELTLPPLDDVEVWAGLARRWVSESAEVLGREQLAALAAAPRLPERSLSRDRGPCGEPGTLWGILELQPEPRRRQASAYAWTPKNWQKFLDRLDTYPLWWSAEFSSLGKYGTPGDGPHYLQLDVNRSDARNGGCSWPTGSVGRSRMLSGTN